MLNPADNDLLTKAAPGTPLGDLMRRYWMPALLSEEIPEADGPPVPVRLLGEELVAFRDTLGRVGLLAEHCAHRGTSLTYGRNEECGLRCVYHGWKYNVEGRVLDTPAEPPQSQFKNKVRQVAYPIHEAGGMVFAYMGPAEKKPLFPNYPWTAAPLDHTYVTKSLLECNWLQGLEGECDSAHLNFLHRWFRLDNEPVRYQDEQMRYGAVPKYETEETDFGVRLIALRKLDSGETYVRVSSFVMPVSCWISAFVGKEVHIYVPIDDTHTWRYDLGFRFDRPVLPEEVVRREAIGPDFRKVRNSGNRYLQDREMQKEVNFTGLADFLTQDGCATETMGPRFDRGKEHLGTSDQAVIVVRGFPLNAVKSFQEAGQEPPHLVTNPAFNNFLHVDTIAETIPAGRDWRRHFTHLTKAAQAR
jgi:nitrite reductase/ring-hydroxylating ferredoxin subunit